MHVGITNPRFPAFPAHAQPGVSRIWQEAQCVHVPSATNPYVVVTCGEESARSGWAFQTENPTWNFKTLFYLQKSSSRITIEVGKNDDNSVYLTTYKNVTHIKSLNRYLWTQCFRIMWIHYNDVIMSAMAPDITSLTSVYSAVDSSTDQRKHQSSASLAFVCGEFQ